MDNHVVFVETLHTTANEAGVSIKLLAKLLGVSRTSLFKYRNGEWKPSDETLSKMNKLLAKLDSAIRDGSLPAKAPTVEDIIRETLQLQPE